MGWNVAYFPMVQTSLVKWEIKMLIYQHLASDKLARPATLSKSQQCLEKSPKHQKTVSYANSAIC